MQLRAKYGTLKFSRWKELRTRVDRQREADDSGYEWLWVTLEVRDDGNCRQCMV